MNKYYNKILVAFAFVLGIIGFASCTDYLDKSPKSDIDPQLAFKNFRNFQGFTEELYSCLPLLTETGSHNCWNFGEDEYWEPTEQRILAYNIDRGDYWAWQYATFGTWFKNGGDPASQDKTTKGAMWGLSWYGIRKANMGLANLSKLVDATQEEKDLVAGQLYFFRGWFHYTLMEYWGGLPYVSKVLPTDQSPRLARLSYQALADSVALDFKKAAELLPVDWDETLVGKTTLGNNNLRINKIMALAYLGKNYLWAGSPLMNYSSTGSKTYNAEYCKKASDAFAQALQIVESTKRYELANFANYSELFYTWNSSNKSPGLKESIFMENMAGVSGRWRWNQVNDYRPMCINNSGIKVYPTANYVDNYGMANGLPIVDPEKKDPVSGYDPEYPWRNRDPRFYNDIIYDAVQCTKVAKAENVQYASLYSKGWYRSDNPSKYVFTGYMNKKFTSQFMNDWDGYLDNNIMVLSLMRLADVYLLYAEATAVGYGTPQSIGAGYNLSAVGAVDKIRDRAGVGHVASQFLGSTESFLPELRRERAVELAFEGHRFVDLRRWMLLLQRPYTYKKSIEFDRDNTVPKATLYADPKNAHVLNFRETVLFERQYSEKHYWFPFIKSDVEMYKEFKQNPGW